MQLKSYEAASIQEAMALIRKEMGEDAVILSTNRKDNAFEVVAARDGNYTPSAKAPSAPPNNKADKTRLLPREHSEIGELREDMAVLFDILGAGRRGAADEYTSVYHRLVTGGMSRSGACKIAETMRADGQTDVFGLLKKILPVYEPRKRIRALVGPTGAGKTTTLAKLAAETAFEKKCATAIITTDTHRIAATEQIRIYAKIMDIPMAVAPDRTSYVRAVERFADKDIIYVDTPGRSHNDKEALESLSRTLGAFNDTEACLVLAMTSTREHLVKSVSQYGVFENSNIIFTKLDECDRFGAIYDVVEKTGIPISYFTVGQNVPEDIEKATSERIAELILGR
jgi:flagellar biosynthesis protein FlhF